MKNFFVFLSFVSLMSSCTEDYNFNFPDQKPKLVVEATITNGAGPHCVRLSLSKATFAALSVADSVPAQFSDGFQPVTNATVVIRDNQGNTDTLVPSPDSVYHYNRGLNGEIIDSVLVSNYFSSRNGYYQTKYIVGKANNTYYLTVIWKGDVYESSCFMPQVPEIDSVSYSYTKGETGKSDYFVPKIWFKDNPETQDYYLFKTEGSGGVWARSIISDESMKKNITGLNVFQGESSDWWMNGYPQPGANYRIEMNSITKEVYQYYQALIAQFRSDGGIYTPCPASPPSNISNGALGVFRASSVKMVQEVMPYSK